jgi:hypothetical protein
VLDFVISRLDWLDSHSERGITHSEAYETSEMGSFEVWRGKQASRLLLQPGEKGLYGYAVITNKIDDYFFRKSRTCARDGKLLGKGQYKRSMHKLESRDRTNIDLIYDTGHVLLLSMLVVGAGYKVFPRRSPEPSPEAF